MRRTEYKQKRKKTGGPREKRTKSKENIVLCWVWRGLPRLSVNVELVEGREGKGRKIVRLREERERY